MNAFTNRVGQLAGILVVATLINGCKTGPRFALTRYQPASERFAAVQLSPARKVYLCPVIARLDSKNVRLLDREFSVSEYLTDALEQELNAAGVKPEPAPFQSGAALSGVAPVITRRANRPANAVYVAGEVLWFGPVDTSSGHQSGFAAESETFESRVTIDVAVYSASGKTLFAKRGLCSLVDSTTRVGNSSDPGMKRTRPKRWGWMEKPETSQTATQMALRQIVADPAFQKALQ
ncbi:MAG: hypothetical protein ACLQU4_06180 [Limisphaerales bacterium]